MSLSGSPASDVADLEAPPAFLKPMPTHRPPEGSGPPLHAVTRGAGAGAESSTLTRLFPLADSSDGSSETAADVAGLKLSHFVIEERIGRGGMGAVFRAIDQQLDRIVALKVLAPEHSRDPAAVQRFHNEARAAARLDHENIARAYYFGEDEGLQFIAFEFVRGTNIRDFIIQKGKLSPAEVVNYALQITQALRHTHAAGVVHRDIKPSNIIITPSGRAKLVDLGLARQENGTPGAQDLTVAGTTLGTFDYIAPEQARDPRHVDVRADIYALGCTLYHMLTGEPPFPSGSMIQKVVDHHRGAAPDPADLNPAVPPQLSRIVRRMMASNPDERYPTPDHLLSELATVAHAMGLRPEHPDGLVWATPLFNRPSVLWLFWHQNRAWLLTIAALLAIVFGIHRIPWEQMVGTGAPEDLVADAAGREGSIRPAADEADYASDESPLIPPLPDPPLRQLAIEPALSSSTVTDPRVTPATGDSAALTVPGRSPAEVAPEPAAGEAPHVSGRGSDTESPDPAGTPSPGQFVVLDGAAEAYYPSLEAACQQAPEGALIELRFDDPHAEWNVQVPIVISDKKVVISAQPGTRPTLVFTAPVNIGLGAPTQMIRVRRGSLQLNGVDILMEVKNIPTDDDWAFIVLDQADRFHMRDVSVRVDNPHGAPASIIELAEPTDADLERMTGAMNMRRVVAIEVEDCLLTGRCDFLKQNSIDPASVLLSNVATALRGTLFRVLGEMEGIVDFDQTSRIDLRHVSAILEEGLLRVDTQFAGDLVPMDVVCEESLVLVHPDEPLIEMYGHQARDFLRASLQFRDDLSYFDLRDPAWVILADGGVLRDELYYEQFGNHDASVLIRDPLVQSIDWERDDFFDFDPRDFQIRSGPTALNGVGVRWPVAPPNVEE